tara:strand:- start:438 stop:539 length:102 start_codon:yes stop_codon:yes gene_type:complete
MTTLFFVPGLVISGRVISFSGRVIRGRVSFGRA